MATDIWPFEDKPNVMVITLRGIVNNNIPILSVWHDKEDGMWQFLDSLDVKMEDAVIVALEEIVEMDRSLTEIADLPLGWVAWRKKKGAPWNKQQKGS